MVFTKRLRERVRRGEITCSVRFWTHPHVTVGSRYRMGRGAIEIDSIEFLFSVCKTNPETLKPDHWISGYHSATGAGVRIPGRARLSQSSQARTG